MFVFNRETIYILILRHQPTIVGCGIYFYRGNSLLSALCSVCVTFSENKREMQEIQVYTLINFLVKIRKSEQFSSVFIRINIYSVGVECIYAYVNKIFMKDDSLQVSNLRISTV